MAQWDFDVGGGVGGAIRTRNDRPTSAHTQLYYKNPPLRGGADPHRTRSRPVPLLHAPPRSVLGSDPPSAPPPSGGVRPPYGPTRGAPGVGGGLSPACRSRAPPAANRSAPCPYPVGWGGGELRYPNGARGGWGTSRALDRMLGVPVPHWDQGAREGGYGGHPIGMRAQWVPVGVQEQPWPIGSGVLRVATALLGLGPKGFPLPQWDWG